MVGRCLGLDVLHELHCVHQKNPYHLRRLLFLKCCHTEKNCVLMNQGAKNVSKRAPVRIFGIQTMDIRWINHSMTWIQKVNLFEGKREREKQIILMCLTTENIRNIKVVFFSSVNLISISVLVFTITKMENLKLLKFKIKWNPALPVIKVYNRKMK